MGREEQTKGFGRPSYRTLRVYAYQVVYDYLLKHRRGAAVRQRKKHTLTFGTIACLQQHETRDLRVIADPSRSHLESRKDAQTYRLQTLPDHLSFRGQALDSMRATPAFLLRLHRLSPSLVAKVAPDFCQGIALSLTGTPSRCTLLYLQGLSMAPSDTSSPPNSREEHPPALDPSELGTKE